jgi:ribosome-binding factor A
MASTRQQRIQQLLIEEVSDIVRREVKDPRIGFLTITGAEVSPDLRHARVFLTILGTEEEQAAGMKGLQSAARFIRREFGRRCDLRVTPAIEFRFDTAIQHGVRMFDLLEQIKREEEVAGPSPQESADEDTVEAAGTATEGNEP